MIRTFIQERTDWDELIQIDTESGRVKSYSVEKTIGFPFAEYYTTVSEMGYKSIDDCIKRMKKIKHAELETAKQTEKEIQGIINLVKYRAEHRGNVCMILKDGTKYNDIVERLKVYGLSEADASAKIDCFFEVRTI